MSVIEAISSDNIEETLRLISEDVNEIDLNNFDSALIVAYRQGLYEIVK